MRFAFFYHTVRSDWNNGHAHFLRGVMRALQALGHESVCYEEAGNWSVSNLVHDHGLGPLVQFRRRFPFVRVRLYDPSRMATLERQLARELSGVDVVLMDEWPAVENQELTDLLIRLRRTCGYTLLLRDAHYRILTQPVDLRRRLEEFDAVLAYGPSMADEYRHRFGLRAVHVVHEAADTALFRPVPPDPNRPMDDAIFVGNWGDRDRAEELRQFLLRPARTFRGQRRFVVHGVRYPREVLDAFQRYYGVEYRGWLLNFLVPRAFAQARVGIHVIRRQYARLLYGIPTIRVFEALASGLPLISTRWQDTDHLFHEGRDYLMVDNRKEMQDALAWLWEDESARQRLARNGRERIRAEHTCMHRAQQILDIVADLRGTRAGPMAVRRALRTPVGARATARAPLVLETPLAAAGQ